LKQPSKTARILESLQSRLERGEIELRVRSQESDRLLQRNYFGIKCLIYTCISGFTLVAGTVLLLASYKIAGIASLIFSGLWFVILLRSLIKLNLTERLDRLGDR
ncbi:MAG: AarF/ABC1/UbiB kinase family protein, partial [Spirulinaceae cyanobacterium]